MATVFEQIVSEEFDSGESPAKPVVAPPCIRIISEDGRDGVAAELATLLGRICGDQRETLSQDCARLLHIVATSEPERATVLGLRGQHARGVLDELQSWLDKSSQHHMYRRVAIYLLVKLSAASNELPSSLFIHGVDSGASRDACRVGGFADVFRAKYQEQTVAVKRLRVMEGDKADMHPRFCREALIWRQLRHANVLPFIGVDADTFQSSNFLCMVSPWMEDGTIVDFLNSSAYIPAIDCDRLLREAGEGLLYLHSQKVVHGDINGANIFVDKEHHARLADFGLISLGDKTAGRMSTTMGTLGTVRWMAPERLHAESNARRTIAGDMYAFGCLCLYMYTHKQPFCHLSDFAVIVAVALKGELPHRPTDEQCRGMQMSDDMWALLVRCWDREPSRRPSMAEVLEYFGGPVVIVTTPTSEGTTFLDEEVGSEPTVAPLYVRRDAVPKGLWRQRQQRRLQKQKQQQKSRVPGWSRPARVLIVDDDAVVRMLVSKFLQIFGCTIEVATNGADAVEKMNNGKNQYDLVLMDIMMPKLDGLSATSMIRQFDPRTPIISMTSASSPADVQNYMNSGMNDILPKPFSKNGLFEMLEKHLDSIDLTRSHSTKEKTIQGNLEIPKSIVGASSTDRRQRSPSPSRTVRHRSPLKILIPNAETSPASLDGEESPIQIVRSPRSSPHTPRLGTYTPFARGSRARRDDSGKDRYQPYPKQRAFPDTQLSVTHGE